MDVLVGINIGRIAILDKTGTDDFLPDDIREDLTGSGFIKDPAGSQNLGNTRIDDNTGNEVNDFLKLLRRDAKDKTHLRGSSFDIPTMCAGNGKTDITHPLTADGLDGDFDAAFFADLTGVGGFFVLAATTLIVLDRTEDFFGKESLRLRLKRTVVDGFVLGDFVLALVIAGLLDSRPALNLLRAGESNLDRMKFVQFKHDSAPSLIILVVIRGSVVAFRMLVVLKGFVGWDIDITDHSVTGVLPLGLLVLAGIHRPNLMMDPAGSLLGFFGNRIEVDFLVGIVIERDIDGKTLKFLKENTGGFWPVRMRNRLVLKDSFVGLVTADPIIGFDCKHFLQGIGGTIGFQGPDLHFTETLSAFLGFSRERLLGDKRIRTDGTGMDLIFDHVVELNPVPYTDGNTGIKRFAGLSIIKDSLSIAVNSGLLPEIGNFLI